MFTTVNQRVVGSSRTDSRELNRGAGQLFVDS